jgi:hypothetical protein
MIKLIALLILVVFALAACDAGPPEAPAVSQEAPPREAENGRTPVDDPPPVQNGEGNGTDPLANPDPPDDLAFAFNMGSHVIEMDQSITDVIQMLGEPLGVFEAPSCAFDGIDRVFSYPGVQIHTYPGDDDDYVHTISLRDDSVKTMEGIYLGSSLSSVIEVYGNDFVLDSGMYTFTRGQTTLAFYVEDDMVIGITYGLIME